MNANTVSKLILLFTFVSFKQDEAFAGVLSQGELLYYKNMTQEKKDSYKEIFTIFDADGGGSIQNEEIMDVMKTLGQNPTMEDIMQMISEIDENGDGSVDFDEFLLLMVKQEKAAEDEEEELVTVFKMFANEDNEGDWQVSADSLVSRFEQLGEVIDYNEATEMININDADGDGYFNFAEFLQVLMYDARKRFSY